MKQYKRRPGVVLLTIDGEHLLVATKEAREHCPYVTQINDAAADCWRLMEKSPNPSLPDLIKHFGKDSGDRDPAAFMQMMTFINKMKKAGYLLEEEIL